MDPNDFTEQTRLNLGRLPGAEGWSFFSSSERDHAGRTHFYVGAVPKRGKDGGRMWAGPNLTVAEQQAIDELKLGGRHEEQEAA